MDTIKKKVLICWTGFGNPQLDNKLVWLQENLEIIEGSKDNLDITYRIYCYEPDNSVNFPNKYPLNIIYRKGIVFQFMYEELKPQDIKKDFDYLFMILDDVCLDPTFSLSNYIAIYEANDLDIIQCSLTENTKLSHLWMKVEPNNKVGRLVNMIEYFCYLLDAESYEKYYNKFLNAEVFWGHGIDMNLGTNTGFRLGLVDKYKVWHRIYGASYKNCAHHPWKEMSKWHPCPRYICHGYLNDI
jgi:hypothetical protein